MSARAQQLVGSGFQAWLVCARTWLRVQGKSRCVVPDQRRFVLETLRVFLLVLLSLSERCRSSAAGSPKNAPLPSSRTIRVLTHPLHRIDTQPQPLIKDLASRSTTQQDGTRTRLQSACTSPISCWLQPSACIEAFCGTRAVYAVGTEQQHNIHHHKRHGSLPRPCSFEWCVF